ncbi:MAG: diguanylate cyclase [Alphaproteobacteria bacterium CG_4_10_14_0_2_um_filter_63_37]|nr:MAG: diguanylate cyclase [Proteobacteria bacterium CG1_02_64_396]PJA24110.1 MAG: diguanylate cyclase [Alphaproteobacteria bacterium CG_4_10_14_0_2_um_filter_63_37]
MIPYLLRRLGGMLPLLLGITLITFAVIHLAPGSPVDQLGELNPKATEQSRLKMIEAYNLDKPLWLQYGLWLERLATLDFGTSFAPDGRPVWDKIVERIPITLVINLLSMLLIVTVAVPLGVVAALKRNSWLDGTISVFVFIGFAIPTFWLALLLMILFGVQLGWLPISGLTAPDHASLSFWGQVGDYAKHLLMPVLLSAFGGLAGFSRFMRSSTLEVLHQDFVTTARAKGLPEAVVIRRHILRNAWLPIITLLGLSVPGLIGGSVIFETIYAIPGMGQLFYQSVMMRDYPLVMGILVLGAVLTLLGNLIADLAAAASDPRIRKGLQS